MSKSSKKIQEPIGWQITHPLLLLSAISLGLLVFRIVYTDSYGYWFLSWNLLLAWVPLVVAIPLVNRLSSKNWLSWSNILLSVTWLLFLPNSFYLITDYIHLQETTEISLLFDVVLLGMFSFLGFFLGFVSLHIVHDKLNSLLDKSLVNKIVSLIILLSSFAIYLGRYLRWNSWDIFLNPIGLLLDIGGRIINPFAHGLTYSTTALFFVSISCFYFCMRSLVKKIK